MKFFTIIRKIVFREIKFQNLKMQKNKQNLFHQICGDRFIPTEVRKQAFHLENERILKDKPFNNYQNFLNENILKQGSIAKHSTRKIMNFTTRKTQKSSLLTANLLTNDQNSNDKITQKRRISKKAYKVLQAPNLQDNFYLNLVDWSKDNHISVALQNSIYLWNHHATEAVKIYETSFGDEICSVSFCNNNILSVGNTFGEIGLVDVVKRKKIQSFDGHLGRVGSLNWGHNLLASGSKDGSVGIWDLRCGLVNKYKAHTQQICGLKWSPDSKYIASGGNDNKLVLYSHEHQKQIQKFHEHTAAIKAIGWSETNPSMLASGGGTADKHIRFFSTKTLKQSYHIDTGSQVCNLMFSKISNEMITTHGYSLNQINVWNSSTNWEKAQGMNQVETLTGHRSRVLYLAGSPDGSSVVTGAGDETLRFWNVFDNNQVKNKSSLGLQMDLR